jgi:multidrug resistance efflux pump
MIITKRHYSIGAFGLLALAIYIFSPATKKSDDLFANPIKGDFQIDITVTGELEAKTSVNILGPSGLRSAQIWQVKINDMVDEGTVVQEGEFIAKLDQSELIEKVANQLNKFEESQSKYIQIQLDTTLTLRNARDELINLNFDVEEKEVILDQSQYEPPAAIKQAEIDLEKAARKYRQTKENYLLKKQKAEAEMNEARSKLKNDSGKLKNLNTLLENFSIIAPAPGMVIYHKDRSGKKIGVGSQIRAWNPIVATLPDLSQMISKVYINEIDIRNINAGQKVMIGLDAFPLKKLSGEILSVANIGEQKPNSDSKVFEARIKINESDTTLRPAMTTSNTIISEVVVDALYIPLESVFDQGDTLFYVLKKDGGDFIKQEISLGKKNSDFGIVLKGVALGDQLYLTKPEKVEEQEMISLNATN